MVGVKRTASDEETVAPRINSGHLSDQFQRELSSNGDDLLQDELTIDDINSASGSGPSGYSSLNTTPLSSPARPNMLPSTTWQSPATYNASPFAAFSGAAGTSGASSNFTSPQDARFSNGQAASNTSGGASASAVLSQAYRQPSKIPRLASASSISQQTSLPVRQGSKALDRSSQDRNNARTASGALRKKSSALPSASKPKPPKAPARSPSQSLSDTSEDPSLPAWRLASRVAPPKYTQQTDKALGGPFQRSSSSSAIPKPGKGRGKSPAQAYTASSSSKAAQDMQRYRKEHSANGIRTQEPQLAADTLSDTHLIPQTASAVSEAQSSEPHAETAVNSTEAAAAPLQQPAEGLQQPAEVLQHSSLTDAQLSEHQLQSQQAGEEEAVPVNGIQQPNGGMQASSTEPQVEAVPGQHQNGLSPDQVGIEVTPQQSPVVASAQHSQSSAASPQGVISEADEAKLNKKVKCCSCTIM